MNVNNPFQSFGQNVFPSQNAFSSQGFPGQGFQDLGTANSMGMPFQGGASPQMAIMQQMLTAMLTLLQQAGLPFGQNGQSGSLLPSQAGFGSQASPGGAGGVSNFLGGDSGAASTGAASSSSPGASNGNAASPVAIGPGTKVLEIGDSHSVGTFGQDLDAKLRGTGAQVSTYASAGATASSFVNGSSNKYGYWEKKADGSEKKVGYGKSQAAPKLDSLIGQEKPDVIIVNLGANFRGSNPKSEVDKIGQIAKKHGIPIVWVGPPKTKKDNANPSSIQQFDQKMAEAVAPYGKYVASSGLTPKYSGGDGLHYSGAEGTQIAHQWADGVFKAVTGR